jgi:hypothetical protein
VAHPLSGFSLANDTVGAPSLAQQRMGFESCFKHQYKHPSRLKHKITTKNAHTLSAPKPITIKDSASLAGPACAYALKTAAGWQIAIGDEAGGGTKPGKHI